MKQKARLFFVISLAIVCTTLWSASGRTMLHQQSAVLSLVDVVPLVADWNDDGIFDLLVSTRSGEIHVLETAEGLLEPTFTAIYTLSYRENGAEVPIKHLWEWITPRFDVVDWDGDGLLDLLVGDKTQAIYFYKARLTAEGSCVLSSPAELRFSDGSLLAFPRCFNRLQSLGIRAVDWDCDTDIDVVLGLHECYYLENTGTRLEPVFERPPDWDEMHWCQEEGGSFHEYYLFSLSGDNVVPNVIDWDGDERLDLVLGFGWRYGEKETTHGHVILRLNDRTNSNPSFPDEAVHNWPKGQFLRTCPWCDPIEIGTYSTLYAVDVNDDERTDLLVGGDGPLRLYVRTAGSLLKLTWELEGVQL